MVTIYHPPTHFFILYFMGQHCMEHPEDIQIVFAKLMFPLNPHFIFPFIILLGGGDSLLWNIHWETFFTPRSLLQVLIKTALQRLIIWQSFLHIYIFWILLMEWLKIIQPIISLKHFWRLLCLQSPQISDKKLEWLSEIARSSYYKVF